MYVAIDGSFILETPLFEVKEDGDHLHSDIFDCDSLIAPTVAILNSKGYPTLYSCQGHMSTHSVQNSYDDGKNKATIIDEVNIYTPYIMFDYHQCPIKDFISFGIPTGWYIEFLTEYGESIIIKDINDEKSLMLNCNYCIRLCEDHYFEKVNKYGKEYTMFDFYEDMIKEHRKLYQWANSIPQKPKQYKIKKTIILKNKGE